MQFLAILLRQLSQLRSTCRERIHYKEVTMVVRGNIEVEKVSSISMRFGLGGQSLPPPIPIHLTPISDYIFKKRRNPMTYGPVDFLALEFKGNKFTGEILPALRELVENKIVRVIDLVIVMVQDGKYQTLELQQMDASTIAIFDPLQVEISGMIQVEDIEMISQELEDNTTAALLMVENLWAIKFGEAVLKANGRVVRQERIPMQTVNEVMEMFAEAESSPQKISQ
jgi:Family of unknown function (DUF6325)